jgi:HrpA-like RNA helicase
MGSEEDSITFPSSLNAFERRYVHYLANQLGLISKSSGKGLDRKLTVRRPKAGDTKAPLRAPALLLHPESEDLLLRHVAEHPLQVGDFAAWDMIEALARERTGALAKWREGGLSAFGGRSPLAAPAAATANEIAQWQGWKQRREQHPQWADARSQRCALPAWRVQGQLCEALGASQVVVVSGDTGCGKSTQVPQFLLDDAATGPTANIIVTQPRRISAISLAERVSWERCEEVGQTVGYNVRLESASSAATRVMYVTTGVLLRRLISDPALRGVTHVVIDEAHERDINTDFLLIILREMLPRRPDLKLIVMSATIQIELFVQYFSPGAVARALAAQKQEKTINFSMPADAAAGAAGGAALVAQAATVAAAKAAAEGSKLPTPLTEHKTVIRPGEVSTVHVAGSTFPVTRYFLEDILTQTKHMDAGAAGHARLAANKRLQGILTQQAKSAANPTAAPALGNASAEAAGATAAPPAESAAPPTLPLSLKNTDIIGAPDAAAFTCSMCGKQRFRSAAHFGEHAAMCMGPGSTDSDDKADDGTGAAGPARAKPATPGTLVIPDLLPSLSVRIPDAPNPLFTPAAVVEEPANAVVTASGIVLPGGVRGEKNKPANGVTTAGGIVLPGGVRGDQSFLEVGDISTIPEVDEMLGRYMATVDDDEVDMALIQSLLAHIVVQQQVAPVSHTPTAGAHPSRIPADTGRGAVLVFLPGWEEISRGMELLREHPVLGDPSRVLALALHSSIPTAEQRRAFKRPPPGVTKIIFSTNIAETSITIDDVVYVIDAGRVREKTYDPYTGCSALTSVWASKASARQRAGRAGRVRPGIAYHIFSKKRLAAMPNFAVPEMLRMPLDELALQIKMLRLTTRTEDADTSVAQGGRRGGDKAAAADKEDDDEDSDQPSEIELFLARALQPPPKAAVRSAVHMLHDIGALRTSSVAAAEARPHRDSGADCDELTPLGLRLAQLPMSPRLGKMILFATMFRCLDPVLTMACAMTYRPPWTLPRFPGERAVADKARLKLAKGFRSDHMALLGAYAGFHAARKRGGGAPGNGAEYAFCSEHFISGATMNMVTAMRDQMVKELLKCGVLGQLGADGGGGGASEARTSSILAAASVNGNNHALVLAVLAAGMYPNVARANPPSKSKGVDAEARAGLQTRNGSKTQVNAASVASVAVAGPGHTYRPNDDGKQKPPPGSALTAQSNTAVEWLVYDEMMKVGSFGTVALRGVSVIPTQSLVFLCARQRGDIVKGAHSSAAKNPNWNAFELVLRDEAEAAAARAAQGGARKGTGSQRALWDVKLDLEEFAERVDERLALGVAPDLADEVEDEDAEDEDEEGEDMDDGEEQAQQTGGSRKRVKADGRCAVKPLVSVDNWIAFTLPSTLSLCLTGLRNRLLLAFHRLILLPEAAEALAQKGVFHPNYAAEDKAVISAVADLLTIEVLGSLKEAGVPVPSAMLASARPRPAVTIAARPASAVQPQSQRGPVPQQAARAKPQQPTKSKSQADHRMVAFPSFLKEAAPSATPGATPSAPTGGLSPAVANLFAQVQQTRPASAKGMAPGAAAAPPPKANVVPAKPKEVKVALSSVPPTASAMPAVPGASSPAPQSEGAGPARVKRVRVKKPKKQPSAGAASAAGEDTD